MNITPHFRAKVVNGKLTLADNDLFKKYLKVKVDNRRVVVTIEEYKPKHSSAQKNYYFVYLTKIQDKTKDFADDLHEYFKRKHLKYKMINVMGTTLKIPGSIQNLSKDGMSYYLDCIKKETKIDLPDRKAAGYFVE